MKPSGIPKFANSVGAKTIRIGVREFECMGAKPPHDHPHVYLDMGRDGEIICPYCSTLYVFDASLGTEESVPPDALFKDYETA